MRLWNRKGEVIGTPFVGHQDGVNSAAFSSNEAKGAKANCEKYVWSKEDQNKNPTSAPD